MTLKKEDQQTPGVLSTPLLQTTNAAKTEQSPAKNIQPADTICQACTGLATKILESNIVLQLQTSEIQELRDLLLSTQNRVSKVESNIEKQEKVKSEILKLQDSIEF